MKTKELLYEWKSFLQKDIINEISIKRFQEQHPDFDTSRFSNQLKGNTDYLDIINNSIESGQQHGPDDYLEQFEFYKNSIEPNRNNQEFLTINIPGESDPVSLVDKVTQGSCTATFDDIQQFQQARMFALGKASKSKLNAAYEKVINEASQDDFELIVDNNDWVVYYPKSIRGSIALARSYWDGSKIVYDNTFNPSRGSGANVGIMKWCTSISGPRNMFVNYHRRLNMHMYYCISKKNDVNSPDRKLCISLTKTNGEASLADDDSAVVNAENSFIDKEYILNNLSKSVFDILLKDSESSKRPDMDLESYYSSISLEQFISMRQANEDNIEDFLRDAKSIIELSKDSEKIIDYCMYDKSPKIVALTMSSVDLEGAKELFEKYVDNEVDVIRDLFKRKDCNQIITDDLLHKVFEVGMNRGHKSYLKFCVNHPKISEEKIRLLLEKFKNSEEIIYEVTTEKTVKSMSEDVAMKALDVCVRKSNYQKAFLFLLNKSLKDKTVEVILSSLKYSTEKLQLLRTVMDLPQEIINTLIEDEDFRVSKEAKNHYSKIKYDLENNDISYLQDKDRSYKLSFFEQFKRKLITPEILDILSDDSDYSVSETAKRYKRSISKNRVYETKFLREYVRLVLS